MQTLLEGIAHAKTDENIKGMYLDLSIMPNSYATVEALRASIVDFKESKKFVIAYGEMFDQKSYYLASVADKIYANPEGYIELRGIGAQLTFFKKLLEEKLSAEVQVFKVGDFKSAVEPFINEKMSDENREQLTYLLSGIKNDFIGNVAKARGITPEKFDTLLNKLSALDPDSCVIHKLIDATKYYDEILVELKDKTGTDLEEDLSTISLNDYALSVKEVSDEENKIALVFAEGDIVDGDGDEQTVGGAKFAKIFRDLREDENVSAIVIRINSPGGSALASEVMWREIELAKKVKPIVVSMGSVAASGGYYIACNANKIYAEDNTITGSIGVFGLIPNLESFLNDKVGVTFDEVSLNTHANSNGITQKLDPFEANVIQKSVEKVYTTFTTRVAEGRNLPIEKVLEVAGGRVWTGEQAKERGLVDEIGNLSDALAYAAELAKLDKYAVEEYPLKKSPFEEIFSSMENQSKLKALEEELGVVYPYYLELQKVQKMQGVIQAKLPYLIEIK